MKFPQYHDEVLRALQALGNPSLGRHIAKDRGSSLRYVGIRVPALRRRVKQGFSFYDLDHDSVLAIWDDLWMESEWGDVLFAAEEYYRPIVRKRVDGASMGLLGVAGPEAEPVPSGGEAPDPAMGRYWPVMKRWIDRVDNWCHADALSATYSRLLEADAGTVMPVLDRWNRDEALWPRRVSIVSLIHYTGKNAVFLPPDVVLPMVDRCVEDRRQPMQKAVGWVLREMWRAYPEEIEDYLQANAPRIAPSAYTRAIERMDAGARKKMRASVPSTLKRRVSVAASV
ncbi:MAG: DNA alkylation repair protein, partial [Gammaproteobacteria bacterium]|nr:DNA alkylation repair protein [Gammaproteobacteria bacterium]